MNFPMKFEGQFSPRLTKPDRITMRRVLMIILPRGNRELAIMAMPLHWDIGMILFMMMQPFLPTLLNMNVQKIYGENMVRDEKWGSH
jgi:hypothetical protein